MVDHSGNTYQLADEQLKEVLAYLDRKIFTYKKPNDDLPPWRINMGKMVDADSVTSTLIRHEDLIKNLYDMQKQHIQILKVVKATLETIADELEALKKK